MKKNRALSIAPVTAPLLVVLLFLLLSVSGIMVRNRTDEDIFALITVVQLIIFIFPCIIYYFLKGRRLTAPVFMSFVKPGQYLFCFFSFILLISGTLLIKFLFYVYFDINPTDTGYLSQIAVTEDYSIASIFISLALIPAVCEEIFFRGIILSEYRSFGTFNAVMFSSLCFAMSHFSFELLPVYIFNGIVLGMTAVICRSIFAPILIHIANNTVNIFASDLFIRITVQKSGPFFVGFVLVSLIFLSLILVVSRIEHIFWIRSEKPPETSLPPKSSVNIAPVFLSPAFFLVCFAFVLITLLL